MNIGHASLRRGELEVGYASGPWQLGAAMVVIAGQDHGVDLNSPRNDRLTLVAAW